MEKKQIVEEMARIICKPTSNKGNCDKCGFKKQCSKFDDATDLYNAGYRNQEWISVDEALPTEWENVLVFEDGGISIAFIDIKSWWDYESYYKNDTWHQVFPTHWMPLPEAPKGGTE